MSKFSIADLERIAKSGAGFTLNVSGKSVADVERLAKAANVGGGTLLLNGTSSWSTADLERIGKAGGGRVILEI